MVSVGFLLPRVHDRPGPNCLTPGQDLQSATEPGAVADPAALPDVAIDYFRNTPEIEVPVQVGVDTACVGCGRWSDLPIAPE